MCIRDSHNLKGFAYLAADKQNLATQSFRKAAEVDARNATAWNNLGAQYLRTGNFKTAGDCFTYATKLDPAFYKAHLNLGSARRALGDVVNAERSYQTALKLRPEYREAYFSLGVLYLAAADYPGIDTTTRLTRALNYFSKYRESAIASGTGGGDRPGDDVTRGVAALGALLAAAGPARADEFVSLPRADAITAGGVDVALVPYDDGLVATTAVRVDPYVSVALGRGVAVQANWPLTSATIDERRTRGIGAASVGVVYATAIDHRVRHAGSERSLADQRRGLADEHQAAAVGAQRLEHRRVRAALVVATPRSMRPARWRARSAPASRSTSRSPALHGPARRRCAPRSSPWPAATSSSIATTPTPRR